MARQMTRLQTLWAFLRRTCFSHHGHGARFVFIFLLTVLAAGPACAYANESCAWGKGSVQKQLAGFQIRISPHQDTDDPDVLGCRAEVLDPNQKVIFSEDDQTFSIALLARPIKADAAPVVVLEAYSGGAHCCWAYYILLLGPKAGLIKKLENQRDATFNQDEKTGNIEISTLDGAFDYFDGLCHACTPFPMVFLRLEGTHLTDVSSEEVAAYDQTIRRAKKDLSTEELKRFRALGKNLSPSEAEPETVYKVLTIVLAYLYSGRDAQAQQALQSMWPPFDEDRMWKLIQETRHDGILTYTRNEGR